MKWRAETLARARRTRQEPGSLAGEMRKVADDTYQPGDIVRCECGRTVQAQMMILVTAPALQALVRKPTTTHVCDGCHSRWVRERRCTEADLREALGAPPEIVERYRARKRGRVR